MENPRGLSLFSVYANQLPFYFEATQYRSRKIILVDLNELQKKIVLVLNDGIEEIDTIHPQTKVEVNIFLATLLELKLAGKVESFFGQI